MHLHGRLEGRNEFLGNRNRIFGARIAAYPSSMRAQRECSKTTQLNPITSGKPISNGAKDGIHDLFEIMPR